MVTGMWPWPLMKSLGFTLMGWLSPAVESVVMNTAVVRYVVVSNRMCLVLRGGFAG